jgi:hypothetical protein
MPVRTIPKILTVADWNRNKGVIAKMAGETGIGAALAKLKTEFDKIPWDVLDPDAALAKDGNTGIQTIAKLDKLEPLARAQYGKVKETRDELAAIVKLTTAIEAKWRTSKVIPNSSRKHVGQMKVEAGNFDIALKSIDNDWKAARVRITKAEERLKAVALQKFKVYITQLRQFGKEVKEAGTVEAYLGKAKTGFHQNIRGLNAALERSNNEELIAWKDKNWKAFAQDAYKPTSNSQVAAKVDKVLETIDDFERVLS